jgi:hypothetical protein
MPSLRPRQDHRPFNGIHEFPHISWPLMSQQAVHCLRCEPLYLLAITFREMLQKMLGKQQNILYKTELSWISINEIVPIKSGFDMDPKNNEKHCMKPSKEMIYYFTDYLKI